MDFILYTSQLPFCGGFTFGSMTGSGYISASQDRMKSRYDSVQEQTGLFAGDGGFDITVGNHTQLDGTVIASTAALTALTLWLSFAPISAAER